MLTIGCYTLPGRVVLAPMAGVTDQPFRHMCRSMGAALAVSEMVTSNQALWHTRKSRRRMDLSGEPTPRCIQIAGGCPDMLASAAQENVARGAQIIDINMGCPAKKVCKKSAGSALLKDEALVFDILSAVVNAVRVPVTLKIRTGWDTQHRNGLSIARMAEDLGIQALAVHGRTRACGFGGEAEYDTIAKIKQAVAIPVLANGDINSPKKAKQVLQYTGADGVMVGRAVLGRPWVIKQIASYIDFGVELPEPEQNEQSDIVLEHLRALHQFYGEYWGVRIARKHMSCFFSTQQLLHQRRQFNQLETGAAQINCVKTFSNRQRQSWEKEKSHDNE